MIDDLDLEFQVQYNALMKDKYEAELKSPQDFFVYLNTDFPDELEAVRFEDLGRFDYNISEGPLRIDLS